MLGTEITLKELTTKHKTYRDTNCIDTTSAHTTIIILRLDHTSYGFT